MSTIIQSIRLRGKFPYRLVESEGWVTAKCDMLKINGQGRTAEEAHGQLKNAVQGFLQVCFEDGTVNKVMKDAGFAVMRVGGETFWVAEGQAEPGVEHHALEFSFSFRLKEIPEVPEQRDAIHSNIFPWMLATGSGQPSQNA